MTMTVPSSIDTDRHDPTGGSARRRVADAVPDIELAAYQRAVRTLLVHPLVTENAPRAGALASIRRFEAQLRDDFHSLCRYRLEVGPDFARLLKRPLVLDPTFPARSKTNRAFDRRRYSYLCLALAAVLSSGAQILLSQITERVAGMANDIEQLGLDPAVHAHRMALVDAIRWLEAVGAMQAFEGSTDAWAQDTQSEALYDINRDIAHLLFQPGSSLQRLGSIGSLVHESDPDGRDARRRAVRQRLLRRCLERPSVLFDDLDSNELAYIRREASSVAGDLERFTGGVVERRAEGLALVDPGVGLSDRRFPGTGTPAQAALLLLERLCANADRATAASTPRLPERQLALIARIDASRPPSAMIDDRAPEDAPLAPTMPALDAEPEARTATALVIPHGRVTELLAAVMDDYHDAFSREYRDDPAGLRREVQRELEAFDLVRVDEAGWAVVPMAARYRVDVEYVPLEQGALFP